MAFFGLFGKKRKDDSSIPAPPAAPKFSEAPSLTEQSAPVPPFPLKEGDKDIKSPQHVDDFGIPAKAELDKGDTKLELPELELPDLPEMESKEISGAIDQELAAEKIDLKEEKSARRGAAQEIPEELPELGMPQPSPLMKLEDVEEPMELRPTPKVAGPVFIRSDRFREMKDSVISLRDNLMRAEERLNNLSEIRNKEDSAYESWHSATESIQRKLAFIDRTFFETNR